MKKLVLLLVLGIVGPAPGATTVPRSAFLALGDSSQQTVAVSGIPLAGRTVALSLTRFEVFTEDVWIDVHVAVGRYRGERPAARYFRGTVAGEPGSLAFVALDDDVFGLVVSEGHAYSIGSQGDHIARLGSDELLVKLVDELAGLPQALECDSRAVPSLPRVGPVSVPRSVLATSTIYDIRMAIETDYEFYRQLGSVATFTAYIGRFMGAVSAVFKRDINVNLVVGYLSIWTTPDDPWSATTALAASVELGDYWHANHTAVSRSLVHFRRIRGLEL